MSKNDLKNELGKNDITNSVQSQQKLIRIAGMLKFWTIFKKAQCGHSQATFPLKEILWPSKSPLGLC